MKQNVPVINETVPGILAMLGALVFILPGAATAITSFIIPTHWQTDWQAPVTLITQQLLMIALSIWYLRGNLGLAWADFGIVAARPIQQIKVGVFTGFGMLGINVSGLLISQTLAARALGEQKAHLLFTAEQDRVMGLFQAAKPLPVLFVLIISVGILAPLAEELFFRAYLYGALKQRLGVHAIWVSSLFFVLIHFYLIHALPLFMLGLVLALLYEKTKSIWSAIIAHGTMNLLVAFLTLGNF